MIRTRVKLNDFLFHVSAIAADRPSYELGKDGSGGKCDCIGLIIGAIRRSGGKWDGIHGTNYTARSAVDYIDRVSSSADLTVGELVFKAREPGADGYALPSRYDKSPDQRDYYHVGVVTGVNPLKITHCTSPGGIKIDTKLGAWKYRAWCSEVEQKEAEIFMPYPMIVTATSGKTVNMRERPDLSAPLVKQIEIGETVTVVDATGEWAKCTYGSYTGYIMTKYLDDPAGAPEGEILPALYAARDAINEAIRQAGGA